MAINLAKVQDLKGNKCPLLLQENSSQDFTTLIVTSPQGQWQATADLGETFGIVWHLGLKLVR